MKTIDFEKKIQDEIDSELTIRVNPNHDDIAGVYWKEHYLGITVPPEEIRETYSQGYTDALGNPYRNIDMAWDTIQGKLLKFKKIEKEDPDLLRPVIMKKDPPIQDANEL